MKTSRGYTALAVVFVVILAIIVAVSIWGIHTSRHRPEILQGTIEADQVRISGKLPGRIGWFYVSEGDEVCVGDTLVHILSPEAEAKRSEAVAMARAAQAQSRKVDGGMRKEVIRAAKQMWQSAKAQRELAEQTYGRIQRLWADSVVTLQRRDETEAMWRSAVAMEKAAREEYLLALRGAQREDKVSAQSVADAAGDVVEQVDAVLDDAFLCSPIDGQVAVIYPCEGELVGTGTPIMTIVPLSRAYAVWNIREDRMPLFPLGTILRAAIPALALEDVEFRIDYISPLGSYATWKASGNVGSYDMRTFEVKAHPTCEVEGLRPGMSVLVDLSQMSECDE